MEEQPEPTFELEQLRETIEGPLLSDWIICNQFTNKVKDHIKQELEDRDEESGYKVVKKHLELFNLNEFTWEIAYADVKQLRKMTNIKDVTSRKHYDSWMNWTYSNPIIYQETFPLHFISQYVSRPYSLIGYEIYDEALRVQCDLLQIFLIFHLRSDFRHHQKICGSKYKILDPISRLNIREKNKNDQMIMKKYFNVNFDLKEFIFKLYEDYFPNVTSRYVGSGHYAHRITIQITEFLFQIGLWDSKDIDRILKVLLEKSENLLVLEKVCVKDAKTKSISTSFQHNLSQQFADIKYNIATILLHCIVLQNDESLKQSLNFTRSKKTELSVFKEKYWRNAYYKNQQLNNVVNNIIMKYLLRDNAIQNTYFDSSDFHSLIFVDTQTKTILNDIFMMMSDMAYDVCYKSSQLVNQELIAYFHTSERKTFWKENTCQNLNFLNYSVGNSGEQNPNQIKNSKPSNSGYLEEAFKIRMELINLIEDISNGTFGTIQYMGLTKDVNKVIKHVCDRIGKYFGDSTQGLDKIQYYNKQLALCENNVVQLLLVLATAVMEMRGKEEVFRFIMNQLVAICKDNYTTQAQLFIGENLFFFKEMNDSEPMLGAIIMTSIFEKDTELLYTTPELFETMYEMYKSSLFDMEEVLNPNTEDYDYSEVSSHIMTMDTFNKYFMHLLSDMKAKKKEKLAYIQMKKLYPDIFSKLPSYDLRIQQEITPLLIKSILPILSNPNFLPRAADGKYDYMQNLPNEFRPQKLDSTIFAAFQQQEVRRKGLIFDVALSFLMLYNTVTNKLLLGGCQKRISKALDALNPDAFAHLKNLPHFTLINTEIMKLKSTFLFFSSNVLLTGRLEHNQMYMKGRKPTDKEKPVKYMEKVTLDQDVSQKLMEQLNLEFQRIPELLKQFSDTENEKDEEVREKKKKSIRHYFYTGLLPMVYQFVKNIQSTFFINHKLRNTSQIDFYTQSLKMIFQQFNEHGLKISQILGKSITTELKRFSTNKNLQLSNGSSIKSNETSRLTNGNRAKVDQERNLIDMDEEEILYPRVYSMRKTAENIMQSIENCYPLHLQHIITKYVRFTANKRDEIRNKVNKIGFKFHQADKLMQNFKIDVNRNLTKTKEAENRKVLESQSAEMQEFRFIIQKYKEEKLQSMDKKTDQNCTIEFLRQNQHQIGNTLSFILSTIYQCFKPGEEKDRSKRDLSHEEKENLDFIFGKDYIVNQFFKHQYLYPYFIYLDKLISTYDEMKHAMFYILSDPSSDTDRNAPVWQEAHDNLFSPQLRKIINTQERKDRNKKVLSIAYYLFTQLGQFSTFKTFQDRAWSQVWDRFFVMGRVIKNLSEDNANYFKLYLGNFYPKIASDKEFCGGGYSSIVFDSFVRLESLTNLSLNWYNSSTKLSYYDRPEISIQYLIWFEFVTEFVTGPCPKNQRVLYRYKTSNWVGIMMREVDDVNSVFYSVKNKCIDYILGLIEGEGVYPLLNVSEEEKKEVYQCSKWMSASITPSNIITMMFKILKRLVIYRKMSNSPSFKSNLLNKVQKSRREKEQFEQKNNIKTPMQIKIQAKKINAQDQLFSIYDNVEATVTEEMLEAHTFKHYEELVDLYLEDLEFSQHILIKICLKLYSLLMSLANQSKSTTLFIEQKKIKLSKFYGEALDLDDRVYGKSWANYKQLLKVTSGAEEISEEMIFFMFILKISKKIEVAVHPPALEKPINKEIYFPLLPETFFLEEKTKSDTIKEIEVENRRIDFQRRYPQYFIEMEQNYQLSLSKPLIYSISKNDTLQKLKLIYYFIGLLINCLVIIYYRLIGSGDKDDRKLISSDEGDKVINWTSAVFSLITFVSFLIWLFFRAGAEYSSILPKYILKNPGVPMPPSLATKVDISINWVFVNSKEALNFLFHAFFALISIFTNPFFTSLHLLLFINISTTANYVIKAATAHVKKLGATLVLAVFTIWSFAIINALYFSGSFDMNDGEGNSIDVCSNMFRCLVYNLNQGLRNGGGIADDQSPYSFSGDGIADYIWQNANTRVGSKVVSKTLFDLSFFIIINVIYLNIIFGIIIDTFGEMRGEQEERQKELEGACMICMNSPNTFEEARISFDHHTSVDHDMWLYPSYIYYLSRKDESDFNGDEFEIFQKYSSGNDGWMPYKQTIYLEGYEDDDEAEYLIGKTLEKVNQIEENQKEIIQKLNKSLGIEEKKEDSLDLDLDLGDLSLDLGEELDLDDLDLDLDNEDLDLGDE